MKRLLTRAKNDGYRIVYLDETCFTRSTVPKAEYCQQGQNVAADLAYMQEPTLAVLASISIRSSDTLQFRVKISSCVIMPCKVQHF